LRTFAPGAAWPRCPESEQADVIEEVVHLCNTHPDLAGVDRIEFPDVTEAYRAQVNRSDREADNLS
jgi:hypothetical protein